eukprot:16156072-Heterocapsa_arctica.AAC.1
MAEGAPAPRSPGPDDAASTLGSLVHRRRELGSGSGSKRLRGGGAAAEKKTVATEWLANPPPEAAVLVAELRTLPPSVITKLRLTGVGHGTR